MSELLQTKINNYFQSLFIENIEAPEYIESNINHKIRKYQRTALRNFIYTQRNSAADIAFNHLLFHMATGSGKTLVLAGTILYFYQELKYNKLIFFVHSDAIIKKTIDNLLNSSSPKYLFNKNGIVIEGERITIKLVDSFPLFEASNTIYIKMTTIQKLHLDFNQARENALSIEDLKDKKIILLSDEAHHINAATKRKGKKTAEEVLEETWEHTVSKLLRQNKSNRLIEFTATINLEDNNLYDKYSNKIVYQYDLKKLMNEGFSKKVVLLRRDETDEQKLISSILLNQYKKYIARDNGIYLKPVILFKSNKIAVSKNINQKFLKIIEDLNSEYLKKVIDLGRSVYGDDAGSIWHLVYNYYSKLDLEIVVKEIKEDFRKESLLNANEKSMLSENNSSLLNTLESSQNPIRAIFAVAKLNEGWDVLNLFDIVRINESATNNRSNTDSEAQLIGRGARYYPFVFEGQKSYKRRFDDIPSDLKVIETLHYHTINDNSYIKNLSASLSAASIEFHEDKYIRYDVKVKNDFKRTNIYKEGKIYVNEVIEFEPNSYNSLKDYGINLNWHYNYTASIEQVLGERANIDASIPLITNNFIPEFPYKKKAMQRNAFYRLKNLKKYFTNLPCINSFINDDEFLGGLEVSISMPAAVTLDQLTPEYKLSIIEEYLRECEQKIKKSYLKAKGTLKFRHLNIKDIITDYTLELSQLSAISNYTGVIKSLPMKNRNWYVYDEAVVNGLEQDLIEFIADYITNLRTKYEDVYLIRNERKIKLVEIDGIRGFMPDFILYLRDAEEITYQVFIEPKGEHLFEQDKWKEEMLLKINDEYELDTLHENEFVKIIGLRFYRSKDRQIFKADFETKLL